MSIPREQLQISETATIVEGQTPNGNVLVHLMRPCLGKGKGRHIYEAAMLEREAKAGRFTDWPMFVDHESPEAKRKAQGLPRSLRDLGGRVVEARWDPSVPADTENGFGPGAVVAEAKPVPWVRELIEHDPQLVNVSLNTYATGVQPRKGPDGRRAWVVEGFADRGSADWVTLPGAGGRVVELLEAAIEDAEDDGHDEEDVLEAVSDEELAEHIKRHRPQVAEALQDNNDAPAGEEDDMDRADVQEAAIEVFQSDEGKAVIAEAIKDVAGPVVKDVLTATLPAALGAAAEEIAESARAVAGVEVRRGKAAEDAAKRISEAKLPEKFATKATSTVAEKVAGLEDKTDDDGKVTESIEQQAVSIVEAEVKEQKELVGSIAPTRVREAGDGGGPEAGDVTEAEHDGRHLRHELQEAGVPWQEAWGTVKAKEEPPPEKDKDKDTEAEAAAA